MNMNRVFPFVILLSTTLVFTACNSRKTVDQGYYFENFDNLKYWSHDVSVTSEKAHSGSWSAFTDESHEFSQTFEMEYPYLVSKGFRSVTVTAWIYKTDAGNKGGLVTSLEGPEGKPAYVASDISASVKETGKWERISTFLKLPDNAPGTANLKVYLWSPEKHKIFMDDLSVDFHK